jgi:rare lipoprotein A
MKKFLIYTILFFLVSDLHVHSQKSIAATEMEEEIKRKEKTAVIYGTASFYSNKFHGRRTASGEIFSQQKMTAACNVLPLGTWIRVTNIRNNRTILVKVNDRLHNRMKRAIDLSREAANRLGFIRSGLAKVRVEVLGKKKPAP